MRSTTSCTKHGARAAAALLAGALLAASTAASAAVEPGGGSAFDSDTSGWTSTTATCEPAELCAAANAHDPDSGNPKGSLHSNLTLQTGLLTFEAQYAWRSESFRVPGEPGEAVSDARFTYDRRFGVGALINLKPQADVEATVVDETAGTRTELIEETLGEADDSFETRELTAPAGAVTREHIHHLELAATVRTTVTASSTTGSSDLHFDNVALDIPKPPGNSEGVTFPLPPKTGAEIKALMLTLDPNERKGDGPGGSVVPVEECTILGTSGGDRITGTSANDVICGLGGNDRISARGGRDVVDAAGGKDRVGGGQGGDFLLGLKGKDLLKGKKGRDKIGAGGGRDKMRGHGNDDRLYARDGSRDLAHGGAGQGDRVRADKRDRVVHAEQIRRS